MGFVSAVVVTNESILNINEDSYYLFNFSVNNTGISVNANITELDITLTGSGLNYLFFSNGTNAVANSFVNTSSLLSWTGNSLVMNSTKKYFWFNASAPNPGTYYITVSYVNSTASYDTNFTLKVNDITPPSLVNIAYPVNTTYNATVTEIDYTAIDFVNLSYCWYTNSSGSWNSSAQLAAISIFSNVTSIEGSNTFRVYCNDSSGNVNSSSVTFIIDTTNPYLNITNPLANSKSNSKLITINLTATDANFLDTNISVFSGPSAVLGGNDVSKCSDLSSDVKDMMINLTNQGKTIVLREGDQVYYHQYFVIGNNGTYTILKLGSVSNASFDFTDDSVTLTDVLNPNDTILVNIDSEGIADMVVGDRSYNVYYSAMPGQSSSGNITFKRVGSTQNNTYYNCNLINTTINLSQGISLTPLSVPIDGVYSVYATSYDTLGHSNSSIVNNITIDSTAPSLTINYPINGNYYLNSQTNLTYSAYETSGYCWYTNSSGVWNSSSQPAATGYFNITTKENSNVFTLYCNDSAGNLNSTSTTFTVDTINPYLNITNPLANSKSSLKLMTVNLTATDANFLDTNISIFSGPSAVLGGNDVSKCSDLSSNVKNMMINLTNRGKTIGLKEGDPVYNRNYFVISSGYGTDAIIKVFSITNYSSSFTDDSVELQDAITGDMYPVNIDSEGVGDVTVGDKTYMINYVASPSSGDPSLRYITWNYTLDTHVYSYYNCNLINSTINLSQGITLTPLSVPIDGIYSLYATSYDLAGHTNYSIVNNITVDTTAPILTVYSPISNATYFINQSIQLYFTRTDLTPGSMWYNNGTNNFAGVVNYVISNLTYTSTGIKNISFYSNDSGGFLTSVNISFNVITLPSNSSAPDNDSNYNVPPSVTDIIIPYGSPVTNINASDSQTISLNLSQLLNNGTVTMGNNSFNLTIDGSSYDYSAYIPGNTVITGDTGWDGKLNLPRINLSSFITPVTSTSQVVIDMGNTMELSFSVPVRVIINNMAGQKAAWTRGNSTLVDITTMCDVGNSTDGYTTPTVINSNGPRECYINDGSDLVIWTMHFTTFAAYTPAPADTGGNTGGSSGGGGGSTSPAVTYNISDSDLNSGYTKELATTNRIKFSYNGVLHFVTLMSTSSSQVTVLVSSTPQQKVIPIGSSTQFDIDGDNVNDISVKYVSFANNKATLTIQKLSLTPAAATPTPATPTPAASPEPSPVSTEPTHPIAKPKIDYVGPLIIIIIVILIGLMVYMVARNIHSRKIRHIHHTNIPRNPYHEQVY